jgi:voltage-gated potassium channel
MGTKNTISSTADGVLGSPLRNLAVALIFVCLVFVAATAGYPAAR